jgi:hypothetical protein
MYSFNVQYIDINNKLFWIKNLVLSYSLHLITGNKDE